MSNQDKTPRNLFPVGFRVLIVMIALVVVPGLYGTGYMSIETVNMLGRYLAFAMVALAFNTAPFALATAALASKFSAILLSLK